jgi:hypothetical protein
MLGDAGIPHRLKFTKMGWPYIVFEAPAFGGLVSLQYRARRVDRETKRVRDAHYLIFYPLENGHQGNKSCSDMVSVIDTLGIDEEKIAEGQAARAHLSLEDRAISVVDPFEEASYLAKMR